MAYIVNNSRGEIIAVVNDGTVNTEATSVTLVGKNVTPYGEFEVENLVKHLENFANTTAPANPIEGQLWYDISGGCMRVFTGDQWKRIAAITAGTTAPSLGPEVGDLWWDTANYQLRVYSQVDLGFEWVTNNRVTRSATQPVSAGIAGDLYWNTTNNQMWISDGNNWDLVGPPTTPGFDVTRWESGSLPDTSAVLHPVIFGTINNETVAIVSGDTFTILEASRPTGFVNLRRGLNVGTSGFFNGLATSASVLSPGASINGTLFTGASNITITNAGTLTLGNYLTGTSYNGGANVTSDVDATPNNTANKVVARNGSGNFAAGTITANLIGNVTGIANNVNGIVAVANGGTGQSTYANGQILIGNAGTLSKGTIAGSGAITVTNSAGGITIGYTGGTGSGTVTSVGITAGTGIAVSGSPITGSGSITVENAGVTSITAGSGISINRTNGDVTISSTAGGGDVTLATQQTITGQKSFTGGIISQAYNFTSVGNSIFYVDNPARAVQIGINNQFPATFYQRRMVVNGAAEGNPGEAFPPGAVILGLDGGLQGGTGVAGVHTQAVPGLGVGLTAVATNNSYTGATLQTQAYRAASGAFLHIRCYSGGSPSFAGTPVFVVDGGGNVSYDGTASTPAADYAEYFEWADDNPNGEDRRGMTVTLVGNKIKKAEPGDKVIGVVSSNPGIVGDAQELDWVGKYLRDEWGNVIKEAYHVYEWMDENGTTVTKPSYEITDASVIPGNAQRRDRDGLGNALQRAKPNPDYDPENEYVPRSQRKEWSAVGLVGKLRVLQGQLVDPRWIKLRDLNDRLEEWLVR